MWEHWKIIIGPAIGLAVYLLHVQFPILRYERPHRRLLRHLARTRGATVQRSRDKHYPRSVSLNLGGSQVTVTYRYWHGINTLWHAEFTVRATCVRPVPTFVASVGWPAPTQADLDVAFEWPRPDTDPDLHAYVVASWSPRARHLATSLANRGTTSLRCEHGTITATHSSVREADHAELTLQLVAELAGAQVVEPPPAARVVDA